MSARRILSVWFPRLGAERLLRHDPPPEVIGGDAPFAVVRETGQMQVISSVSGAAQAAGVHVGQPLRDAHAMCGQLVTRLQNPQAEAAFLRALNRWAGQFSPWIAVEEPDALLMDISGCAHLFGGEAALVKDIVTAAETLGLTARCGLADTMGAAWALARFAGVKAGSTRTGDAIDQEARATRSRAAKRRHWERGGAAPALMTKDAGDLPCIAPPGKAYSALSPLPVAALRLSPEMVADLGRVGLRTIGDLLGQPRAPLGRRYGKGLILRLDQAIGATAEPLSPAAPVPCFATRLTLPEPIGLREDVEAGLNRLISRLCRLLSDKARGARQVRLEAWRVDHTMQCIEVGFARIADQPDRIRPLLLHRLEEIDAGFGIEMLRLEAVQTEPLNTRHATGHLEAANAARARRAQGTAVEDLMSRIGGRLGMEALTRRHPVDSHIPEKTAKVMAAAWSEAADSWPAPPTPRPLLLWSPEPVHAPETPRLAAQFRWRGRMHALAEARGPERIAPEWWLDEPDWRTGVRDYWQVVTQEGERLWLFYAHGAAKSAGWFCHGRFA